MTNVTKNDACQCRDCTCESCTCGARKPSCGCQSGCACDSARQGNCQCGCQAK